MTYLPKHSALLGPGKPRPAWILKASLYRDLIY